VSPIFHIFRDQGWFTEILKQDEIKAVQVHKDL